MKSRRLRIPQPILQLRETETETETERERERETERERKRERERRGRERERGDLRLCELGRRIVGSHGENAGGAALRSVCTLLCPGEDDGVT